MNKNFAIIIVLAGTMLLTGACQTTRYVSAAEMRSTYEDAHAFLQNGITSENEVKNKYGKPKNVAPWENGFAWRYHEVFAVITGASPVQAPAVKLNQQFGAAAFRNYNFHSTTRQSISMELFFNQQGILQNYRVIRGDGE